MTFLKNKKAEKILKKILEKGHFSPNDLVTMLVFMGTTNQPHVPGMLLCVSLLLWAISYCYSEEKRIKVTEKFPSLLAALTH